MKAQCLVLLALAMCSGTACADIYRYLDENGVTVFTNIPPRPDRAYKIVLKDGHSPVLKAPVNEFGGETALNPSRFASYIQAAAQASGVEPALIHAVISAESGYNPSARSRKGALGLMQLMPETAKRYSVTNRLDPVQNIHGGTRYLRDLLHLFNNDLKLVLAAYNAGEEAVLKYGNRIPPYAETLAYVPKVLAYYRKYHASS